MGSSGRKVRCEGQVVAHEGRSGELNPKVLLEFLVDLKKQFTKRFYYFGLHPLK